MKIVAEPDGDVVENSLCDTVRMAEILKDLVVNLIERMDFGTVPEAVMLDFECTVFAAWQLRDMTKALKVEYYAEFKRHAAECKARPA